MSELNYPQRVQATLEKSTGLCVGLDPSKAMLASWGLSDTLDGLTAFSERMVEVCIQAGVGFVKPQSAFYERFSWIGMRLLSEINHALRRAGIMTIIDCKCGDIGSTVSAYAEAYLSGSDMTKYDAITVNPFLGYDTHQPFLDKIKAEPVGLFMVVRSSNPGADVLQTANIHSGETVATWLASRIHQDNVSCFGEDQKGAIGAVIGATLPDPRLLLDTMPSAFFLCPGVGAQGAILGDVINDLGSYAKQSIFPLSRGITLGVSDKKNLCESIKRLKSQLGAVYAQAHCSG